MNKKTKKRLKQIGEVAVGLLGVGVVAVGFWVLMVPAGAIAVTREAMKPKNDDGSEE